MHFENPNGARFTFGVMFPVVEFRALFNPGTGHAFETSRDAFRSTRSQLLSFLPPLFKHVFALGDTRTCNGCKISGLRETYLGIGTNREIVPPCLILVPKKKYVLIPGFAEIQAGYSADSNGLAFS